MEDSQPNNPLHGVSLKTMLEQLVERIGWEGLASRIRVRCFSDDPTLESSLTFLRKTGWARMKLEQVYLAELQVAERNRKRNKRRAAMRAFRAAQEAGAGESAAAQSPSSAGCDAEDDDPSKDDE